MKDLPRSEDEPPHLRRLAGRGPGLRTGRGRLDVRLFLILLGINLVTFGVAAALVVPRLSAERETQTRELTGELIQTLQATVRPERGANVAAILQWSGWNEMEDAILINANLTASSGVPGTTVGAGIHLNPLGAIRRDSGLDVAEILQTLELCLRMGQSRSVAGGLTVPIRVRGNDWGAFWFRMPEESFLGEVSRTLLPGFLLSTLLISLGTFATLRRLVLSPLERLTEASRRVGRGDLTARVEEGRAVGEIEELMGSFNAMTAHVEGFNRELEVRVEKATAEVRQAQEAARIQQRLAAMGELAAGIAHEINNPLGGLQNAVRALARGGIDESREARYLELLGEGLERIEGTVGQVLRMAPRDTEPRRVDLREVVRDAVALVAHRALGEKVQITVELSGGKPLEPDEVLSHGSEFLVFGVRGELVQAALNLLVNALDALEGGSADSSESQASQQPRAVRIELLRQGDEVQLAIGDNGPGAAPEALERARDLFFTTKDPGRGTGLGLSIVHNICDTHSGRLELRSAPGEGFTAILCLPGLAGDERTSADSSPEEPGANGGAPT